MKYPQEVREFIFKNYKGKTSFELSILIKEKFNYDMSKEKIKFFRKNNKLNSGLTGRFEKGHIPANKGTKGVFGIGGNKTSFKKGSIPHNVKPIGSTRISKDGYVEVKVTENKRKNYKLLHRIVYEKEKGKIPKGYVIVHIDGDSLNNDISNLILFERKELASLNRKYKLNDNKDLNKAKVLLTKLKFKMDLDKEHNNG